MFNRLNCCYTNPSDVRGNTPPERSPRPSSSAGASAAINTPRSAEPAGPLLLDGRNQPIRDVICQTYITQQDVCNNNVETLDCGHVFHKSCIERVRGTDYRGVPKPYVSCPIDRQHHIYDRNAYARLNPSRDTAPQVTERASSALAAAGARDFTTSWKTHHSTR